MRAIELFHLRRVRDKPRALALIAAHARLSGDQALAVLHAAIGGGRPRLCLSDDEAARACIVALAPAGFVARFAPGADFDLAQHAQQALMAALPACAPATRWRTRRQATRARAAGSPIGTVRSLSPLPCTLSTWRSASTASASRPHSSPTRMPLA